MQSQPPVVPEVLQQKYPSLPSLDNLTTEGIFTILEYRYDIWSAHRSGEAPITVDQIVEAELFAHRALRKEAKLRYPVEFSTNPLVNEFRTVVEDGLKPLKDIATLNENLTASDIMELDNQVAKFQRTFGQWAIKRAQYFNKFNSQGAGGTGFQPVPFPDASWPEGEDYPPLDSIQAIQNLDRQALLRYTLRYDIRPDRRRPGSDDELRRMLFKHIGVSARAEQMGLLA